MASEYPFDVNKLVDFFRKNDAVMVGVFGSVARGEASLESDVDLLVRFSECKSLIALSRLEREASAILGRKVDLLTEAAISPYLSPAIHKDLRIIYEA